ncbi:5934_t:CDS:2, partial [Funneliformis geosporum]
DKNIVNAINKLSSEIIESNQAIKLINKDKEIIATIRHAIITYAENLKELKFSFSESNFNNAFLNILAKRFLNKQDLKIDIGKLYAELFLT